LRIEDVKVPPFLPDAPEVRSDICDYYWHVQQFDAELETLIETLEKSGRQNDTLVIVTSDNGMPFPYAKCNLYDAGTRMPLALRWPGVVQPGVRCDELVSLTDIAPTILEAAGIRPPAQMTGVSLMDILTGAPRIERSAVFTERERHTIGRTGMRSYPMRAIRTRDFLYIRNLRPNLWPMGDPHTTVLDRIFADIDASPTKTYIFRNRRDPLVAPFFERCFLKRPEEELYDLRKDPWQLENVAAQPNYSAVKKELRNRLDDWMRRTGDPRANGETDFWDKCPYVTG
jgi:arylsulfatase A-like enzyme